MMKYAMLIFLFCSYSVSATTFYELEGSVTQIVDRTSEQAFYTKYSSGRAHYIIEVNEAKKGWWLSDEHLIVQEPSKYDHYYEANYACGNALNMGYLNNEYHTARDDLSSTRRFILSIGKRVDITFKGLNFADIKVGAQAKSTEYYYISGIPRSSVESDLSVISVSSVNPCE